MTIIGAYDLTAAMEAARTPNTTTAPPYAQFGWMMRKLSAAGSSKKKYPTTDRSLAICWGHTVRFEHTEHHQAIVELLASQAQVGLEAHNSSISESTAVLVDISKSPRGS